jgi:hypothetical protein
MHLLTFKASFDKCKMEYSGTNSKKFLKNKQKKNRRLIDFFYSNRLDNNKKKLIDYASID